MNIKSRRTLGVAAGVLGVAAAGGAASIAAASDGSSSRNRGTGSITVTVTRANGQTRVRPARTVHCTVANGEYVLWGGPHRDGRERRAALTVPGYHGPGSYTGTLRVTIRGPFMRLGGELQIPVTLTAGGGTATITRTLPGTVHPELRGKTVSVTSNWTCTP